MDAGANGLIEMHARYYSSDTGQFTSNDPIGFLGSQSDQRTYAENNPLTMIDPAGLRSFQESAYIAATEYPHSPGEYIVSALAGSAFPGIQDRLIVLRAQQGGHASDNNWLNPPALLKDFQLSVERHWQIYAPFTGELWNGKLNATSPFFGGGSFGGAGSSGSWDYDPQSAPVSGVATAKIEKGLGQILILLFQDL
jgi:RHS repeat-associated protein